MPSRIKVVFGRKLFPGHRRWWQVGKRMADKLRLDAVLAIEAFFEREDHQHLAHVLANALDATLLPRPKLRTDVINDRHAAFVQFACQTQIEVRKVDENGGVWPSPFGLTHHLAKAAIDAWECA